MARSRLKYCSIHGIAYNTSLDRTCPQCTLAHMAPPKQYDFDEDLQVPLDAAGEPLDPSADLPTV